MNQDEQYLREKELADRWRLSERTLQRWRQNGVGPCWIKIGGRVLYPVSRIVEEEDQSTVAGWADEPS